MKHPKTEYCAGCQNEVDRLKATIREQRIILEAVNAVGRSLGYGQGELDDDLAGCLERSLNAYRRGELQKR